MVKNNQNKVFSNIVLVIFLNLIVKPFWVFFIDRVVQVQNGNATYGLYGKYLSLSIVFSILLDLGLSSYNQIQVAKNVDKVKSDFAQYWNAKILLSLLYLVIMHLLFWLIGSPVDEYGIFLTVCFIQVFTSLALYVRSSVSGMHLFRYDAWLSVVDKFFVLVVATTMIYGLHQKIEITTYASLQALGFFLVVALGVAVLGTRKLLFSRFDWLAIRRALSKSAPYAVVIFSMSIYSRFDFFLLERYASKGAQSAGEYMAAYRFVDIITSIGFLFANILLSVFARNIAQKKNSTKTINFYVVLFVGVGFLLASFLHFYSFEVCDMLYEEGVISSSRSLSILVWSIPAIFITNIFSAYITAAQDIRMLIIISVSTAILYLILTIILIPIWGIMATTWASTLTYWMLALVYVFYCFRKFGVVSNKWPLMILVSATSLLMFYMLSEKVDLIWAAVFLGVGLLVYGLYSIAVYRPSRE